MDESSLVCALTWVRRGTYSLSFSLLTFCLQVLPKSSLNNSKFLKLIWLKWKMILKSAESNSSFGYWECSNTEIGRRKWNLNKIMMREKVIIQLDSFTETSLPRSSSLCCWNHWRHWENRKWQLPHVFWWRQWGRKGRLHHQRHWCFDYCWKNRKNHENKTISSCSFRKKMNSPHWKSIFTKNPLAIFSSTTILPSLLSLFLWIGSLLPPVPSKEILIEEVIMLLSEASFLKSKSGILILLMLSNPLWFWVVCKKLLPRRRRDLNLLKLKQYR